MQKHGHLLCKTNAVRRKGCRCGPVVSERELFSCFIVYIGDTLFLSANSFLFIIQFSLEIIHLYDLSLFMFSLCFVHTGDYIIQMMTTHVYIKYNLCYNVINVISSLNFQIIDIKL